MRSQVGLSHVSQVARVAFVVLAPLVFGSKAAAGGLEYPGAGAQSLGRGGAVTARADDAMVLANNPAGLAELRGNQVLFDLNFAIMDACVDPIGFYGWGVYGGGSPARIEDPATGEQVTLNLGNASAGAAETTFYDGQLDTVCMKQNILPMPQVALTSRLTEDLGVGMGLMFPAATPQGKWGGETGVVRGRDGLRPAPTRYMMLNSGTRGVFGTAGAGYRMSDWLRIGATLEWGIINVDSVTVMANTPGTSPAGDVLAHLKATDWFIPAANLSIHLVPLDSLDVVGMFRWQDDLDASGDIDLTTGKFDARAKPRTKKNIVDGASQKFPMKFVGAVRYASRLAPRPTGTGREEVKDTSGLDIRDAFLNERWDVEFDVEYILASRNQDFVIDYQEGQTIEEETLEGMVTSTAFPQASRPGASTDTVIPKRWKNQLSLRLGGSYNLIPGVFGVSAGGHFETRGVDPSYMQVDHWAVQRWGLHAGIKVRVASRIDFVASYAHIFQETLVVSPPPHEATEGAYSQYATTGVVDSIDKRAGSGTEPKNEPPLTAVPQAQARLTQTAVRSAENRTPVIVNAGRYRSGIDVVAVGLNIHF